MRDLNMIAGKISDLWASGKTAPAKNPTQTPATDQKIDKKLSALKKKSKK